MAETGKAQQNYSMMGFQLDHNDAVVSMWDSGARETLSARQ